MKRVLFIALILVLLLAGCAPAATTGGTTAAAASGATTATPLLNKTGFPIVNQPITLKAFAVKGPYNKGDFNELVIWQKYEKMTGIKVEFTAVESAQAKEQLGLIFASNELPDLLFKSSQITVADLTKYSSEGTLVAISDYSAYMPNLVTQMTKLPEIEKSLKLTDGKIYGFPYLVTAQPANISPKLFYNTKWAAAAGVKAPTTTDELLTALRAYKVSDYNKNGQADEIPLGCEYPDMLYRSLYGSFGLCNHGLVNGMWDLDPATSKLRYVATADSYRTYLKYLNTLYTEKLIDQEIFTVDLAKFSAKAQQNLYGFAFIHNNSYLGDYKNDFATLPGALKGPNGDAFYAGRNLVVSGQNTFITKANKYPEATIRWVDYFYSDAGVCLFFMGIEGETWTLDKNGAPQYTDLVKNNPDKLSMEEVLGRYVAWSGGGNPSIADDLHFGNHLIPQITLEAASALVNSTPKEVWGAFTFTTEDNQKLTEVSQDINTYVTDMRAKFITGDVSFDAWDNYVKTIKDMGLEKYTALMQKGLDSYNGK